MTFNDPAEHAFSIKVPQGWKIIGGVYRFGPLDPRLMVDMVSPDGKIDLRVGDYHVTPFAVPTAMGMRLGFREGTAYSPDHVAQEVIARYRPGWTFADLYGQARFTSLCQRLSLKSMKKAQPPVPFAPPTQSTAGEVTYVCDSAGGPHVGYVFAQTTLTEMQGIGNWVVPSLYSFIAPEDRAANAGDILMHVLPTLQVNPQWEAMQQRITGQSVQNTVNNFHQNMAQIQADWQRRSVAMQSQFESMDRVIRGVDLTTDPVDGTQREIWTNTGQTHWINGLNEVVDSPTQPGLNYHQLNTQP